MMLIEQSDERCTVIFAPPQQRDQNEFMRSFQIIRIVALLVVLGSHSACRITPLNKQEVAEWYPRYASFVRWVGYQGSDQQSHRFIARVMDGWKFIQIPREELSVADERPYSTASSAPLYYYLVDPTRDYQRIGDDREGAAANQQ